MTKNSLFTMKASLALVLSSVNYSSHVSISRSSHIHITKFISSKLSSPGFCGGNKAEGTSELAVFVTINEPGDQFLLRQGPTHLLHWDYPCLVLFMYGGLRDV